MSPIFHCSNCQIKLERPKSAWQSRNTFVPLCKGESPVLSPEFLHPHILLTLSLQRRWSRCWSRHRWLSVWQTLWKQVPFIVYLTFLKFKCSGCNSCPACAPGPYGDGIGTGTGVGTLPGAKPLKPPGMCCLHITPSKSCLDLHFFLKKTFCI